MNAHQKLLATILLLPSDKIDTKSNILVGKKNDKIVLPKNCGECVQLTYQLQGGATSEGKAIPGTVWHEICECWIWWRKKYNSNIECYLCR